MLYHYIFITTLLPTDISWVAILGVGRHRTAKALTIAGSFRGPRMFWLLSRSHGWFCAQGQRNFKHSGEC